MPLELPTLEQGIYRHYKGPLYHVFGVGMHSETQEALVFYRALYESYGLFVRPYEMFTESVTHAGQIIPRFQLIQKT